MLVAGCIIEGELYAGGFSEGKGCRKLKEEVTEGTSEVEGIDMANAAMTFHKACHNNSGDFARI